MQLPFSLSVKRSFLCRRMNLLKSSGKLLILLFVYELLRKKRNSSFDFLPINDNRAYINPMNGASVLFSPGEGILNFLYADFDSAYSKCLKHTKKDLPNETSLDISLLTEKEKRLYYYLTLIETQKRFKPLVEASLFTAEFPPIFPHCSKEELTDYYHYLKKCKIICCILSKLHLTKFFAADFSIIFPIRRDLQATAENTAYRQNKNEGLCMTSVY